MRALTCLLLVLSFAVHAQRRSVDFKKVRDEATELARASSLKSDYQGAVDALTAALAKFDPKLGHDEFDRKSAQRLKEGYGNRVRLAGQASSDPRAARALIIELLTAPGGLELAKSSDPRVAALITALKGTDAKAKSFFNGRSVKVTVKGELDAAQSHALMGAVVGVLRDLGFDAGAEGTGDAVVLNATRGETITRLPMGMQGLSCELKVDGTWTSAGKTLMTVELSRRGHGWADLMDRCYGDRIDDIGRVGASLFFKGWNAL